MKHSTLLPPAVLGDKSSLSPKARAEVDKLAGRRPREFMLQLIFAWSVIGAAIGVAVMADNMLVSIVVMLIVASRQFVLFILIHEQQFPAH